jgi:hypothetical protein
MDVNLTSLDFGRKQLVDIDFGFFVVDIEDITDVESRTNNFHNMQ